MKIDTTWHAYSVVNSDLGLFFFYDLNLSFGLSGFVTGILSSYDVLKKNTVRKLKRIAKYDIKNKNTQIMASIYRPFLGLG